MTLGPIDFIALETCLGNRLDGKILTNLFRTS